MLYASCGVGAKSPKLQETEDAIHISAMERVVAAKENSLHRFLVLL